MGLVINEQPAGGGGGGPSLSDASPQALGVAAAGTSPDASRADHVHPATVASNAPGVVGPFIVSPVAAGDDPDPGTSAPQLTGYGGIGVPWRAGRAGSLRSLVVMLTNPAAGSDLIVAVFSDDPGTPLLSLTITGDGTNDNGRVEAIEGAVPIAADQSLALAVWTGSGWTGTSESLAAYVEVQVS